MNVLLSVGNAHALILNAPTVSGTSSENAGYFTEVILDTELSGLEGYGFYWLPYSCANLHSGKVESKAVPHVHALSSNMFRVNVRQGLA